jgi:hypothetical protein
MSLGALSDVDMEMDHICGFFLGRLHGANWTVFRRYDADHAELIGRLRLVLGQVLSYSGAARGGTK